MPTDQYPPDTLDHQVERIEMLETLDNKSVSKAVLDRADANADSWTLTVTYS